MLENYENSSYWVDIHRDYPDSLRAVGWPNLSEEYNKLKYLSETETFLNTLDRAVKSRDVCSILEVGVGIGYWTALQYEFARNNETMVHISALDISEKALSYVTDKFTDVEGILADLTSIEVNTHQEQYDLVTAIMVLLHLTDIESYIHALTFCAYSVKKGGMLMIYEPLLHKPYSPFNKIEYQSFTGNSIPRPGSIVDNILSNYGLNKIAVFPGASWILNSPIQANSKLAFKLKQLTWSLLSKFIFKNDKRTRLFSNVLMSLDRFFKMKNPDSGTFILYLKK